ncbi:Anion permease [Gammaproteobacteria bacterium]
MIPAAHQLLSDPILATCDPLSLSRLLGYLEERSFAAGETLYRAGDPVDGLYLATVGEVRLETPEGVALPWTGGCLGAESVTEARVYLTTAIATMPTQVLHIPRGPLLPILNRQPAIKNHLTLDLLGRLTTLVDLLVFTEPSKLTVNVPGQFGDPTPAHLPSTIGMKAWIGFFRQAGWLMTILLPLGVLWFSDHVGMDRDIGLFLAIFCATVSLWVFSLVDDYLPALFAVMAILISGIVPASVVLAGFASDGFFMAMSILGLSTVIVSSGLGYRSMLLMLRYLPNSGFWHNLGLMFIGIFLTPLIPSVNGRLALVAPLYIDLVKNLGFAGERLAATQLAVSAFGGVSLLSAVFMSSKSINFAVFALLPEQTQDAFQGMAWPLAAAVAAVVLLFCQILGSAWLFRGAEVPKLSKERVLSQLDLLGSLQSREWAALVGVVVMIVGMVTSSLHGIPPPWLAFSVLYSLLLLGSLSKRELKEKTDWPFLLYLSGLTGLMGAFNHLGLNQWLTDALPGVGVLMRDHFSLFILILFGLILLVRLAVPINGTIIIFATLFMPLAELHGVNPWVVGFVILVLGELWFFPYQCSYYLQLQEINRTQSLYREKTLLWHNAFMVLARLAALFASMPYWEALGLL